MKIFKIIHQILGKNICPLNLFFRDKGFSIVGVMVASVVGLVVVSSISQLFVDMSSQINKLEERSARVFFNNQIREDLRNNCKETLSHVTLKLDNTVSVISKLLEGEEVKFTKILRDDEDPDTESTDVIIDLSLSSEKESLEAQYGILGDLHFLLRCTDFSGDCDCNSDPFVECEKRWALTFISQSREKSFLRYVKNSSFRLNIKFTAGGTDPKLECNIEGFKTAFPKDCIKVEDKGPTLFGCGSTTEEGGLLFKGGFKTFRYPTHTALGYNVGSKFTLGWKSTFIGYEAGQYDGTRLIGKTLYSRSAQFNTYVGYQAGQLGNTGSRGNTFVGYQAGQATDTVDPLITDPAELEGLDLDNRRIGASNTFIGYQAGLNNTTGSYNRCIGYRACAGNTGRSSFSNTVIGARYNYTEGDTGTGNVFIGSMAGEYNTTGGGWGEVLLWGGLGFGDEDKGDLNKALKRANEERSLTDKVGNVFVGNNAGQYNRSGSSNVYIGYTVGRFGSEGEKNTSVGAYSGLLAGGRSGNVFLGYSAGASNYKGEGNTFLGYQAGGKNRTVWAVDPDDPDDIDKMTFSSGDGNTFVGYNAGYNNANGDENVFLGYGAGQSNETGDNNVFLGYEAGSNSKGDDNVFVGYKAGQSNATGDSNVFLGHQAGKSNNAGDDNVFIGYEAGYNTTGNNNVFLGYQAGRANTSGSGNIFIGEQAGNSTSYQTENNRLVIGNSSDNDWIKGEVGGDLYVDTQPVSTSSSRTLKKNIRPFKNFEKALEDILKTPLFTFEYKTDHPEKSRMGMISEELPLHLQLFNDKKVSYPDRPSLYGTFWASLKALYFKIQDLNRVFTDLQKTFTDFKEQNNRSFTDFKKQNEESFNQFQQNFSDLTKKREKVNSHFHQSFIRLADENKAFKEEQDSQSKSHAQLEKTLKETQEKLFQTEKELLEVKDQVQRELSHVQKELQKLKFKKRDKKNNKKGSG